MSIIATAVKHLIAAGVTGDALVRAIAEMEAAQPVKVDAVAENRRAYDRERKRKKRNMSGGIPVESADPSPNEIYSNPQPGAKAPSPPLSDRVVEAWNDGPGANGATKARPMDASRRKALSARLREHPESEIFEAIANLAGSEWHCGKNDRGWTANLGWLLKSPENFQKALEMGKRGNVVPLGSPPPNLAQQILARQAAAGNA